jgi:hypothetical protein
MLMQIAVGSGLLLMNITLAAMAAMLLEVIFGHLHHWFLREPHRPKLVLLVMGASVWVLGVITMGSWIWALAFQALGVSPTMEQSLYFSLVAFTTLGLGDIVPAPEWRLLAGMEAANGFLNFGLMTALLIESLRQIRVDQVAHRRNRPD